MFDLGQLRRFESGRVYPIELEPIIEYIYPACDFSQLGVYQNSFVDRQLKLYKNPSLQDVLQNWRLLIADDSKLFSTKCEQIATIVAYINKSCGGFANQKAVRKVLSEEALIPASVNDTFCTLNEVCINQQAPALNGHLYRINVCLTLTSNTSSFFKQLGAVDFFNSNKYVEVINNIQVLQTETQVKQFRKIVEFLRNKNIKCSKLPDETGAMQNIDKLCLNDFQLAEGLSDLKPLYCHKVIPHDLARYFGVKTKRSMLEELSSDLSFEAFSQEEDLCNRLKRITDNYSSPMDVFKELIQNADDAKASQIHFILDERVLEKSRVVNDNWEKLLDPALLVYNDSFFTTEDIEGIKDLGKGSKADKKEKIGQFGVGFNCVYTLTDFPCLLTQVDGKGMGNLCLFDPACQITLRRGRKININDDCLNNFPDTFNCFLREIPEFDATNGHTMFRLPLRRKASILGQQVITIEEFKTTLDQLTSQIANYLLFLQSIEIIGVSHIDESGQFDFSGFVSKKTEPLMGVEQISIFNNGSDNECLGKWIVCEENHSPQDLPLIVRQNLIDRKLPCRASVAYPLYLDSSLRKESLAVPGVWCFLPLDDVSSQIRDSCSKVWQEGTVSALPIAVNASFLLDESRRHLSLAINEARGAWNAYLLEHVVGAAYASLVKFFINTIQKDTKIDSFSSILPQQKFSAVNNIRNSLPRLVCKGFLRCLSGHPWIPNVSLDRTIVSFESSNSVLNFVVGTPTDKIIYNICSKLGIPLTQFEARFTDYWKQCGLVLNRLNAASPLNKLKQHPHSETKKIENSVFGTRDNLVAFLNWSANFLSKYGNPNSLPIFLSSDGTLQQNTWKKLYSSQMHIADIFPRLRHQILDSKVEKSLRSLKITCDLTIDEFLDFVKTDFEYLVRGEKLNLGDVDAIDANWIKLVWEFLTLHEKILLSKYKNVLANFSILMCRNNSGEVFLLPLNLGKCEVFKTLESVNIGPVSLNLNVYSCFYEIDGCLKENRTKRDAFVKQFILSVNLTVTDHVNILYLANKECNFESVDENLRKQLYTYFRDSFVNNEALFDDKVLEKLKTLPIFAFISGGTKSLKGQSELVAIPSDIPKDGVSFSSHPNFVYQEVGRGLNFQRKTGFAVQIKAEFYCNFLMPEQFPSMSESQLKVHLIHLETELRSMNGTERQQIANALKGSKFLLDCTGKRQLPADVYQDELRNVIGYKHPTCNFGIIGITETSILNNIVKFYKTASFDDIMSNWRTLIADDSKTFDRKCSHIGEIITYLKRHDLQSVHLKFLGKSNLLPANDVEKFCSSSLLCLNDSAPVYNGHFYHLNAHLAKNPTLKNFLQDCGVVESFDDADYVNFINKLPQVESEMQMNQILIMLQSLEKNSGVKKLPDTTMVMRPVTDLCLNDFELGSGLLESSLIFSHEKLPHKLCKQFGVKTKRSKLQELNSVSGFEPFFQREDLSRRLARIAESYSNPMDIFKELIQNSDDAGASEIHFILDERKHKKKFVIGDGWDQLLDPGLLVFNNTFFRSSDVEGIQDLGHGSKTDEADKIGQFGVGFNCVYSLTDFPSILTQVDGKGLGDLFMLDPLRKINKKGGARIRLSQDYLQGVPDSFKGYLREISDMDAANGRTMFRFPFRTQRSKLGVSAPSIPVFKLNLQELARKVPNFLVFLNNVRKIGVSKIDISGNFINISSHLKKMNLSDEQKLNSFQKRSLSKLNFAHKLNVIYNVDIVDISNSIERVVSAWIVSQQNGSDYPIPNLLANRRHSTMIKIKQSATVALPVDLSESDLKYQQFYNNSPGVWCFLPLEEVSAQVRANSKIILPVALNAHFLLDESRRMISLATNEPKGAWNAHALEHLVAPAYAYLIMDLVRFWDSSKTSFSLSNFEQLFPSSFAASKADTDSPSIAFHVIRGLLNELSNKNWLPVLTFESELIMFCSETQVKNFVPPFPDNEQNKAIYEISNKLALNLTQISPSVRDVFVENGLQLKNLEPIDLVTRLHRLNFKTTSIDQSVFRSVENLVIFLVWCVEAIIEFPYPKHLPIYLTANNYLTKASEVNFYSSSLNAASIFPQLQNQIMHPEIESRLTELADITKLMSAQEFLSHLKTYFPELCEGRTIELSPTEFDGFCLWVQHVWDFLAHHSEEIFENFGKNHFNNLTILLCQDKRGNNYMKPISCGENEVFVNFSTLKIGSVGINISYFTGFYQLHSCLKEKLMPRAALAAGFVLSDNLTVDQQINVVHKIKDDMTKIQEFHKVQLYEHFKNSFINDSKSVSLSSFNKLREVPIFKIIPDSLENLLGVMRVYSIPSKLPKAGLKLTKTLADKYVLEENFPNGCEFQKRLGIIAKTVEQLYVETLVPLMFPRFEFKDLSLHLEFLTSHLASLRQNKQLLQAILQSLENSEFIEDATGEKHIASYFFAPNCALFAIFRKRQLLLQKYWHFIPLLNQFGLNTVVSKDDFWNFITLYSANEVTMKVQVFEEFLKAFRVLELNSSQFCKIGTLPVFETINHEYRKLSDVFLNRDRTLVEFVAPVLTYSYSQLLIAKPEGDQLSFWQMWSQQNNNNAKPSPGLVMSNIEQIRAQKNPTFDAKISKCLNYIVDEASNDASVDRNILQKLSRHPCVRAKNGVLLPPKQICLVFKCPLHSNENENDNTKPLCELETYVCEPTDTFLKSLPELEKLGATKMVSLQQTVFALEQFYHESVGAVWDGNPNLKGFKYHNLYRHFLLIAINSSREVAQLSEDCPLYLKTQDGNLHNTNECVIIDDEKLFDTIKKTADGGERGQLEIFPHSQILDLKVHDSVLNVMKRLPLRLRPRFLKDICDFAIDERTFEPQNLTSEAFQVQRIESKLADDEILSKIAHVISNKRRIISRFLERGMTRERESVDKNVLSKLGNFSFIPVKTLFYRYILDVNGSQIQGMFEKSFEYTENPDRPTFIFRYVENCDEQTKSDLQTELVTEMFLKINYEQDSKVIEVITKLLFMDCDDTGAVENLLISTYHLPPFALDKRFEDKNEELIGSVVPFSVYALIDRDPKRKFRKGEIVVIESKGTDNDPVYKYGMFVSTRLESNDNVDTNIPPVLMIRVNQFSSRITEKPSEVVFGLKEKFESEMESVNDQLSAEQKFERDVEELKQLIWVAVTSQRAGDTLESNMNKLENRLLQSILQKYTDKEKQKILTRTVKESIKTEMEARRNRETANDEDNNVHAPDVQSDCNAVEELILENFERMNLEIETHQQQLATTCEPQTGFSENCREKLALHKQILQQPQPHPPLARLWLKQAQEHVYMLDNWPTASQIPPSCRNWALDISMQVRNAETEPWFYCHDVA